jgi:hypothetical protein
MKKNVKHCTLGLGILVFLSVLVSPAWAQGSSPEKVVKDFAAAYFMLDPSMTSYLSESARMNDEEIDQTALYLEQMKVEAESRGYRLSYLQMLPLNMKTKVAAVDDSSATVEFSATTLRSINPVYRMVGFVFGLLDEYEVRDVISLVKEDGEWKIGPGAFDMPQ